MSGFTTETGKFIMPVKEKSTYKDSTNRCDSWDSKNKLKYLGHKLWYMEHDRGSVNDLKLRSKDNGRCKMNLW